VPTGPSEGRVASLVVSDSPPRAESDERSGPDGPPGEPAPPPPDALAVGQPPAVDPTEALRPPPAPPEPSAAEPGAAEAGPVEPSAAGTSTVAAPAAETASAEAATAETATARATARDEDEAADGAPPPRRKLRNWQLAALTLLAVGFLLGAFYLGQNSGSDDDPSAAPTSSTPPSSVTSTPVPDGYTTFRHEQSGATLSYPQDWQRLELLPGSSFSFAASPGGEHAVSVRTDQIGYNVATTDLAEAKQLTDRVLAEEGKTEVIEQETLTVNGLSAVYYRYNFTDDDSGAEGVQERFFVFHGGYLSQVFFQALPRSEYPSLAETFARIATTFQAPDPPAAPLPAAPPSSASPNTTAPPATTASSTP